MSVARPLLHSHAPAPRLYLRAWRAPEWTQGVARWSAGLRSEGVEARGWMAASRGRVGLRLAYSEPPIQRAPTTDGFGWRPQCLGLGARHTVAPGERALSRCNIHFRKTGSACKHKPDKFCIPHPAPCRQGDRQAALWSGSPIVSKMLPEATHLAIDAGALAGVNVLLWLVSMPLGKVWPVDFIWSGESIACGLGIGRGRGRGKGRRTRASRRPPPTLTLTLTLTLTRLATGAVRPHPRQSVAEVAERWGRSSSAARLRAGRRVGMAPHIQLCRSRRHRARGLAVR